jgi:hypothetical protein
VKNATRNTACIDRDFFSNSLRIKKTLACYHFTYCTQSFKQKQELANQITIGKQPPAGKQQGKKRRRRTKLVARGEGKKKREKGVVKTYIATKTRTTTTTTKKRRSGAMATYTRTKLSKRTPNGKRTKRWQELPTFS